MTDRMDVGTALEIGAECAGGMGRLQDEAAAELRRLKESALIEASMEQCAAWDNGDVSDSALDPFQLSLRNAYRRYQADAGKE